YLPLALDLSSHLFSFSCYAHHRYLPSFPTRRSSDLVQAHRAELRPDGGGDALRQSLRACGAEGHIAGKGETGLDEAADRAALLIDRKSTRLNSSHRTISYAVFCLKKKKRNMCKKTDDGDRRMITAAPPYYLGIPVIR